jgi:hypothetical protein
MEITNKMAIELKVRNAGIPSIVHLDLLSP